MLWVNWFSRGWNLAGALPRLVQNVACSQINVQVPSARSAAIERTLKMPDQLCRSCIQFTPHISMQRLQRWV